MNASTQIVGRLGGRLVREKILQFVRDFWRQYNHSPSFQDIADYLGMTKSGVSHHIEILVDSGELIQDGQHLIPKGLKIGFD